MFSKLGGVLVGLVVLGCLGLEATAQSYLPGPPATVGDIQHQTVSPFNPGRTDIGIGESVHCWIQRSSWSDPDIYIDAYGHQSTVYDMMGTATWSASGAGSVYPLVGDGAELTADLTDADDTVTVQASVLDSRTMGLDAAVVKTVAFAIKVPTGVFIISVTDDTAWGTHALPPYNEMGFEPIVFGSCLALGAASGRRTQEVGVEQPGCGRGGAKEWIGRRKGNEQRAASNAAKPRAY